MVAQELAPFGTVFLVLPFKNFFYIKIPGIREVVKMDYPKPSAADIAYRVAGFQDFPFAKPGKHTVKMDRLA
jgi:hypothetical protein